MDTTKLNTIMPTMHSNPNIVDLHSIAINSQETYLSQSEVDALLEGAADDFFPRKPYILVRSFLIRGERWSVITAIDDTVRNFILGNFSADDYSKIEFDRFLVTDQLLTTLILKFSR
jgi:hypothetical protein